MKILSISLFFIVLSLITQAQKFDLPKKKNNDKANKKDSLKNLKAIETEARAIQKILQDSLANSDSLLKPKIIYIATHGFFSPVNDVDTTPNPLRRAGLILMDSTHHSKDSNALQNSPNEVYQLSLTADLIVFSLVDSTTYNHWEERKEYYKKQYLTNDFLLAVAKADSWQKTEFILKFYELEQSIGREKAYLKAVEYITQKYEKLDFKHYFGKKIN